MARFFFLFVILAFFIPTISLAQLFDEYSTTIIGNRSNIVTQEIEDFRNYKTGFGIGLHAQKNISGRFSILSGFEIAALRYELDLTQVGVEPDGEPTGEIMGKNITATSNLLILSIPLMAKIKGPAHFFGYLGPRLDFQLGSHNGVAAFEVNGQSIKQEDQISENSEFFVPGWSIGVGRRIRIGDLQPSIAFRYSGDLSRLVRDDHFLNMKKRRFELLINIPLFW